MNPGSSTISLSDSLQSYTLVLSICAIVVPTIGSMISAWSDRRLKIIELRYDYYKSNNQKVIGYLEDFASAFLVCRSAGDYAKHSQAEAYEAAKARALPYLPDKLFNLVASTDLRAMTDKDALNILSGLSEQIETLKRLPKL